MENYFFDTEEDDGVIKGSKYYVLVIYDITDNKRRRELVKIVKSFGFRVQKSAFEAHLPENKYSKLLAKLKPVVKDGDSIRVYKIRGKGAVTVFGIDDSVEDEEVVII
jgi:CRISPR-associated protein Cas2